MKFSSTKVLVEGNVELLFETNSTEDLSVTSYS